MLTCFSAFIYGAYYFRYCFKCFLFCIYITTARMTGSMRQHPLIAGLIVMGPDRTLGIAWSQATIQPLLVEFVYQTKGHFPSVLIFT